MRRLFVICVLCLLLLPGAAFALTRGMDDGSLKVKNGNGRIGIQARGGVIGHFDDGVLTVRDFNPDDEVTEVVTGADKSRSVTDQITRYWGHDIRFRYIGGRFTIVVTGYGINLSAIGRGTVMLQGSKATDDDGTFSFNGAAPQPITDVQQIFQLSPTAG